MTVDPVSRLPFRADGLALGRVAGIPVLLTPSWWLGAVVVTALYTPLVHQLLPQAGAPATVVLAATLAVLLAVSVLAHELGHCVLARQLGIPIRRVRLFLLSGISELGRRPAGPREEGLVALAGPVVSVVLALLTGAVWGVLEPGDALWLLAAELTVANVAVGLFNLLPGLPLDGGRVLRAVVWALTGRRGAGTTAALVGAGLVVAGLLVWGAVGVLSGAEGAWLRLAVCLLMTWFVVIGAGPEWDGGAVGWPAGVDPVTLVRPVLQLPAESPVADALAAAAGRGIVLVRPDGLAVGLLDLSLAARLAAASPHSAAERAADPLRPDSVLQVGELDREALERLRDTTHRQLLVVDAEHRPAGVLRREDVLRAVHGELS